MLPLMHKHFHFTRCLKFDEVWYENWLLVFMLSVVFFLADILCFLKFASVKRIVSVGNLAYNIEIYILVDSQKRETQFKTKENDDI